jgi:very-short-patch-repair endonuclease
MEHSEFKLQEAKARIKRIFRYLQQLHQVRTPPITQTSEYEWILPLDQLPKCPSIDLGYRLGGDGNFLYRVRRPTESTCPAPPTALKNWLKAGWDRYGVEPKHVPVRKTKNIFGNLAEEMFESSPNREELLEDWQLLKTKWESAEQAVVKGLEVFSDLFELSSKFDRESEKFQLYLADGFLTWKQSGGTVRHPLLLQKVQLTFKPLIPEFTVEEVTDFSEIYSPILRYLGIDGKTITLLRDEIAQHYIHPLGGEDTTEFFRGLVQRLWSNGEFHNSESEIRDPKIPSLFRQPIFFLGHRGQGYFEAIERYIESLGGVTDLPPALVRIVGMEGKRSEVGKKPREPDLLLTKHANPEQIRVIRRLEDTGAVLVQGPPGTGKSHTIANLIGRLLAQKKSVLVTSYTSKSLKVVREKVAPPLQPLCVSVLHGDDASSKQLEESISGIVNYLSNTDEKKLIKEIETIGIKRSELKIKLDQMTTALEEAIQTEYTSIEILGKRYMPTEAAKYLRDKPEVDGWIPGPLTGESISLSNDEVEELYQLNGDITHEKQLLLECELPDLDKLPDMEDFGKHFDELLEYEKKDSKRNSEYWIHDDQAPDQIQSLLKRLKRSVEIINPNKDWLMEALEIGKSRANERDSWSDLVNLVAQLKTEIPEREKLVLKQGPKITSNEPPKEMDRICREIIGHLKAGKKIKKLTKLTKLLRPEWKKFLDSSRVDEGPPSKAVHFEALLAKLEIEMLRKSFYLRWDRHFEGYNIESSSKLGPKPENVAEQFTSQIKEALKWHDNEWKELEKECRKLGIHWDRILEETRIGEGNYRDLLRIKESVQVALDPIIAKRLDHLYLRTLHRKQKQWLDYLDGFSKKDEMYKLVKAFRSSIKKVDFDKYKEAREVLEDLNRLQSGHLRRLALIEALKDSSENWAEAISKREAVHSQGKIPGNIESAWKYRILDEEIKKRSNVDIDDLQNKVSKIREKLHEVTADYVEKKSWLSQFYRVGLKQQQALTGWLALHKKIGKGTGKNVQRLREKAQEALADCRHAVPVWIMPLSRVIESFDLGTTRFDVVIIDEASQCDVLGLIVYAIAKEVVVVGDHEQVSPYAVGVRTERVHGLIDELLKDIPNKELYDGRTSIYDLARQSFGGTIRLLEHFRCVPQIIHYSNQLCYNGEILPLREASAARVMPALIAHNVKGGQAIEKLNKKEGLEVAALISAICKDPKYDDCTIGVISMIGTEQALYIDSILRKKLTVAEYKNRQLLCGNAAQFQGDERDVIFLTFVDSPIGKPLTLKQREDARKSFNVAASRARDQLWVVHSLNPGRDLKMGDLRLGLLSYAENPKTLLDKEDVEPDKFSSDFEKEICQALREDLYRVRVHFPVGKIKVDLVVEGANGEKAGIICDGDGEQSLEELRKKLDRFLTLERLGWHFIRIRGSTYYIKPGQMIGGIKRRLNTIGIKPLPSPKPDQEIIDTWQELKEQIIRRANAIRVRWKDV